MHNIRAPNSDPFVHLTLLLKKQNKFLNLTGNENRKVLKSTGRLLFFFFKFNYGTKLKQNKRKEVKQKKKKNKHLKPANIEVITKQSPVLIDRFRRRVSGTKHNA